MGATRGDGGWEGRYQEGLSGAVGGMELGGEEGEDLLPQARQEEAGPKAVGGGQAD